MYGGIKDRFFLKAPEKEWNDETRKQWEAFYKWLGVSWKPKALPHNLRGKEEQDSTWCNGTFSFQGAEVSVESWKQYCKWLYDNSNIDYFSRTPHMVDNRFLDGWERISRNWSLSKIVLQLLTKETVEKNSKATIKYSSNLQKDNRNETWKAPSFLAYSFENLPWLPSLYEKEKIQRCAFDLFMPDSQLDRAFSDIFPCLY